MSASKSNINPNINDNNQFALAAQADESAIKKGKSQRPVLTRDELAGEMMRCCDDDEARVAHQAAADAIMKGAGVDEVCDLMSFVVWPDMYTFALFELTRIEWLEECS